MCVVSCDVCVCVCADYPKWVWMWLKWCNLFFKPNVIFLADNEAAVDCHTALSHMRVIAVTHTRTHAYPASFHRQTHKHARVKITANRSSDYVSVTLNTAWILCTRHITTHTHTLYFFPAWLCLFESVSWWEMWLLHKQTEQPRTDNSVWVGGGRVGVQFDEYQWVFPFSDAHKQICTHTQTVPQQLERIKAALCSFSIRPVHEMLTG